MNMTHDQYVPLENESEKGESDSFVSHETPKPRPLNRLLRVISSWFWVVSTLSFALISIVLAVRLRSPHQVYGTYESGYRTELDSLQSQIELREASFMGGLKLDENRTLYHDVDLAEPQYTGWPSDELDANWNRLLSPLDLDLAEDEAQDVKYGTGRNPHNGKYRISLDVYHSLHCLDTVRRGLDPHYYHPDMKLPYTYRMHIDHCIDYLRQGITCNADLTPLAYVWEDDQDGFFPLFGMARTCRNFEKIQDWSRRRIPNDEEHQSWVAEWGS